MTPGGRVVHVRVPQGLRAGHHFQVQIPGSGLVTLRVSRGKKGGDIIGIIDPSGKKGDAVTAVAVPLSTAIVAAADAAAQECGYPDSAARAIADVASGADLNAVAIDTFVRYGCTFVNSVDQVKIAVRWLIVRGILVEERKVGPGGAATPFHRILAASEGTMGPIGRVALFLDVPLLHEQEVTLCVTRAATSDMAKGVMKGGMRFGVWLTMPIPAGQTENVIICAADGSRVTSFELATIAHTGSELMTGYVSEVSIESVDVEGNPLETLVTWQSCGVCSGEVFSLSDYTPKRFPVVTSAIKFRITLRHNYMSSGNMAAGLAICRAHGSPIAMLPAPSSVTATGMGPSVMLQCATVTGTPKIKWAIVGKSRGQHAWRHEGNARSSTATVTPPGPGTYSFIACAISDTGVESPYSSPSAAVEVTKVRSCV